MRENMVSIVVSVYNEEKVLYECYAEITKILTGISMDYEILFINDGSQDKSEIILEEFAKQDKKVRVIEFSRNFGHEAAMIAGIDYANGELIICMDADLQNPPEQIPRIIEAYKEGNEIILMARVENKSAGKVKNITSKAFYFWFDKISDTKFERNVSDFFAMSDKVAKILRVEYRENRRYLRGYLQSMGFTKKVLEYKAKKRYAGESKYNIKKLIDVSINAITNFSQVPLKIGSLVATVIGLLGSLFLITAVIRSCIFRLYSGVLWIASLISFLFAVQFFILGIIGEYLGVVLSETKKRPTYIIRQSMNGDNERDKKDV